MVKVYEFKESIPQEFERFTKDEMDDSEKRMYLKSKRYKQTLENSIKTLLRKVLTMNTGEI
tara:strand:+ start:534 stop:716 length:183 start_codon:yes stop_codon:yes gene_type:complete